MAHTKSGGSTKNTRDSQPKYLGIKLSDGQTAKSGSILVRQRGSKILSGENVEEGKDHTLFSLVGGKVKFSKKRKLNFTGKTKRVSVVSVLP
ncbi:50S ribosomal protein L27 [Patescibacteria group bacterium]|nr:50S ribosomal protein L27 [Patescibacteria group bacterium]MBU2633120.1 50S ribosomal protein L27 [Patescibacteria group bacterium]